MNYRSAVRVIAFSITALVMVAVLSAGKVSRAQAGGSGALPPNGVYTCDWIATHPAAAVRAGVTCSPIPPPVVSDALVTPVDPSAAGRSGVHALSTTCYSLPAVGAVGKGVFAWSSGYPYTSYWDINVETSPPDYTWYIQNAGGTNVYNEHVLDLGVHSKTLGYNYYRLGAQNHSDTPAWWTFCHD